MKIRDLDIGTIAGVTLCFISLAFLLVAAFGVAIMFLWNWICAGVFGWPALTWLQGCGLFLLLSLIGTCFKSAQYKTK